jgi:hypothetical protein
LPSEAAGPVIGSSTPIVRVVPHEISLESAEDAADGAAERLAVADAAATITNAAPSASKAATAVALLLLISFLLGITPVLSLM